MHPYSFESFLKDKYAALRKHKAVFFMALLAITISSIYLIMATIEISMAPTTVNTDAFANFTFSVNNTEGGANQNITTVSILLSSTNITFNGVNSSGVAIAARTGTAIFSNNGTNNNLVEYNWTTDGTLPLIDNVNGTAIPNRTFSISLNSSVSSTFNLKINITYQNGSMTTTTKSITFNDNVAPVSSNQLPGPDNFTSDTTPTIYINITDTGSDVNITNPDGNGAFAMELSKNSGAYTNITESLTEIYMGGERNGYQVSYTYGTALSGGDNLTIRVNARDNSSIANAMTAAIWTITIDTAVPNVTVVVPALAVNLTGENDNITVQATDQWTRSINTAAVYGALKASGGTYYNLNNTEATGDYTTWTRLAASGDYYKVNLNSSNFSDGTYTLYINASDLAGNVGENKSIKITIDNTAPSAFNLVQPVNYTNSTDRTPTLKWELTTETNFLNYTIQIDDNADFSSINETQSTTTATSNSTTMSTLAVDGTFFWRVIAFDAAGNSRTATAVKFIYIVDNTAPTITVEFPSDNINFTAEYENVTISVNENISAAYAALKSGSTYYDLAGTQATGEDTTWTALKLKKVFGGSISYNATLNASNFSDGTYTLYVNVSDMAYNNATDSSRKVTIDNVVPSAFNLVSPANETVTTNRTPTLRWESANDLNFLNYTIQIDDTADFSSITNTTGTYANATNKTGVSGTTLSADATYYWRVIAYDASGNSRIAGKLIYTTDNTAPTITVNLPVNNTNLTAAADEINVTVSDTNRNSTGVFASLKNETGIYKLDGTRLVTGTNGYVNWTNLPAFNTTRFTNNISSNNFADGSYFLYVNASDNTSNVGSGAIRNITIDNTLPVYSNLLPGDGNLTNSNLPSVYINITDSTTQVDNNTIEFWVKVNTGTWSNKTASTNNTRKNVAGGIQVSYVFTDPLGDADVVRVYVDARDIVGNSMTRANWSFTLDVTAPQAAVIVPANNSNLTGSADNLTVQVTDTNRNNSDVWAALKNSTSYYKLDGTRSATGDQENWTNLKRSGSTNFFNATINSNIFADGEYTLYVNATDLGGSRAENRTFKLHIDNLGPTIVLGTPLNNSNTTSTTLGFVWTATDQISTNMTCNLTLDSSFNKSVVATNATAVSNQTVQYIQNGTHTWGVTCIDELGNTNTSDTRTFNVESGAFTVTLNAPVTYYNSSSATTVRANWTVSNPTYSAVWCNVSLDSTEMNNTAGIIVANGTNQQWYSFNASNGLHEWNVSCRDALYTVNSTTRYFTVDTNAPVVRIIDQNNTNTTSTTPTVTFNATDALSANFTCDLYIVGSAASKGTNSSILNYTNPPTTNATINMSNTAEGAYTYYINCTDYAGNTGQSKKMNITIDTTAPVLQIRAPANNTNLTTATATYVNLTVGVTEPNWQVNDVYAALKLGSTYYNLAGTDVSGAYTVWTNLVQISTSTNFNLTLNASNFTDAVYIVYANASDSAGNMGTAPVTRITIDKTAPVIQNATFNNGSVGTTIGIAVNVSDATSGLAGSTATVGNCTFYFNSTLLASVLYNSAKGGCNTTFTVPGTFTPGNYTLGINITDWANNNGTNTSYRVQVFSDTQAPTISISAPTNYTNQSSTSLNVSWITTDSLDTSLGCNISIFNDTLTGSINSSGNITTTAATGVLNSTMLMGMNSSRYNISVSCWDDALNTNKTGAVIGVVVDAVAPAIKITTQNTTNLSATATTISFNVTDSFSSNFSCELFFGATSKGTNATNIVNSTSAEIHTINASNTAEGSYNYYVNCTDFVGNTGQSGKSIIIFDTSGPAVTINQPEANDFNRSSLLINITVFDAYTNLTNDTLQYRFVNVSGIGNTTEWDNFTLTTKVSATVTYDVTTLIDGRYVIQVRANDTLNNQNATTNVSIIIDNTAPGLTSWNYTSVTSSKNLTLVFNETVDPTTIDLSKIAINYSDGSLILSRIGAGAIVTSSNSSTYSTTINISLTAADYETLESKVQSANAGTVMRITLQAGAIKDRAGSNIGANYTKILTWIKPVIRRPETHGQYLTEDTWSTFSISYTALQASTSLANYNVTNVLTSVSGSYAAVYAYNSTSGSWMAYVPGTGGTLTNFGGDVDSRACEINMTASDAIEIM